VAILCRTTQREPVKFLFTFIDFNCSLLHDDSIISNRADMRGITVFLFPVFNGIDKSLFIFLNGIQPIPGKKSCQFYFLNVASILQRLSIIVKMKG
jgi:hypothetical protein